ncbi:MAG: ABC transporter permease [Acidobacteriota bacterium]
MSILSRIVGVFRAEKDYAELDEELRFHLDERTEELIESGLSPRQARREALRRFGHYTAQREAVRDVDVFRRLEMLVGDVRYGVRQLRLNPGFAIVAILSLGLGIGANSAIFQLIHSLQLRPLPVDDPHRLVSLAEGPEFFSAGRYSGRTTPFTYPQIEALEDSQRSFSALFAFGTTRFDLSRGGESRMASGLFVTPNFFKALGVEPLLGGGIDPSADPRDCSDAGAVLDYHFWQRELGGDRGAIGREISLDGLILPIVGVTPPAFFGLESARRYDVAVPLCVDTLLADGGTGRMDDRAAWWLTVIGRLKAGFSAEQAAAELRTLSPAVFRETVPESYRPADAEEYLENIFDLEPASAGVSSVREHYGNPLWILMASTALVLLLACANLANLLLARASTREREISLRQAIGASRSRLISQLMVENLLLAALGAVLGAVVAQGLSQALVLMLDSGSDQLQIRLGVHWHVLGFTAGVAALTCLLFGWLPALRATRRAPADAMRGGRGTEGQDGRQSLRGALVVVQIALSLVLLVGALLFGQSLRNLTESDTGIRSEGVLYAWVQAGSLPSEQRLAAYRQLEERFGSVPGVVAASSVVFSPFSGSGWNQQAYAAAQSAEDTVLAWFNRVGPDYFSTLGTTLVSGREFAPADGDTSAPVAIVNQSLARQLFGDEDVLGRQLRYRAAAGQEDPSFEIVGVVADSKYYSLRDEERPFAYLPVAQDSASPGAMTFALRVQGPINAIRQGVQEQMKLVDGGLLVEYQWLDELIDDTLRRERMMALLSAGFGVLAALLSALGLYGVMSYLVTRRRREMGVRMALGASVAHLLSLVTREAGRMVALGLACGVAGALALSRFAESLLFGLSPYDGTTLVAGSLLLVATAGLAILVPMRRAARCDPSVVLRDD